MSQEVVMAAQDKQINDDSEVALISPPDRLNRQGSEVPAEVRKRWQKQAEQFLDWIEHGENLDIYQVAAVLLRIKGVWDSETWKAFLKMLTCSLLQIFGMLYLLFYELAIQRDEDTDELTGFTRYCRGSVGEDDLMLKTLGIGFAIWMSLVLADQMVDVSQYGLYEFGTQQPPFVNNFVIYFGLFANFSVSMLCWISTVWIIYFSDNAIDLILNSLAIYFMKTIDDEMVFGHDYHSMETFFLKQEDDDDDDDDLKQDDDDKQKQEFANLHHRGRFSDEYLKFIDDHIKKLDSTQVIESETLFFKDCCGGALIQNPSRCWCILSPLVILAPVYLIICY